MGINDDNDIRSFQEVNFHEWPYDTPLAEHPHTIMNCHRTHKDEVEKGKQIVAALAKAGISTYGRLLDKATHGDLSSVPEIEPEYLYKICRFLLGGEHLNKGYLEEKYLEAQKEIARLKQSIRPTEQLAEAATEERTKGR